MKRATATASVLAIAATTLTSLTTVSPAEAAQRHRVTDYGYNGRAFGSVARAQPLAIGSGPTAPAYLGCTRVTGLHRHNFVASTGGDAGSALEVTGVDNHMRTYRHKFQYGNRATSQIDQAVLGDPDGPTLTIRNLRSVGKAFARRKDGSLGAHGATRAGSVVADTGTPLDDVVNAADNGFTTLLDQISAAGGTLTVPGFGELRRGEHFTRSGAHVAVARSSALRARLYGANQLPGGNDDVTVVLARSRAVIHDEVRAGVFRGRAVPLESTVAGDLLKVGRVNDRPLPCAGTGGKVRSSALASVDLGNADAIDAQGLEASVLGVQHHNRSARGWTRSRVASVSLGGGQVEITGIVGKANVKSNRHGKVVRKGFHGSRIGELVINGETQEPPSPGDVVEVPGVATLEFLKRHRMKRGARITALRITLAPDSPGESVIDLGQAKTILRRK